MYCCWWCPCIVTGDHCMLSPDFEMSGGECGECGMSVVCECLSGAMGDGSYAGAGAVHSSGVGA